MSHHVTARTTTECCYLLGTEEEEAEEGMGEPLILRIDQDDQGSVGSEDTTRWDSDDDMPPIEAGIMSRLLFFCMAHCSPANDN